MIEHSPSGPKAPRRVVVLGGSGFVGRKLVDGLIEHNIEPVSLASGDIDLCAPAATAALADTVRDNDALVFASCITPDRGRDIGALMRNLRMAQALCEFFESRTCAHLVYLSSDAVYADEPSLVSERTVPNPASLYGAMHLMREKMLTDALKKRSVPILRMRLCALYGRDDSHNSYGPNRFIRSAESDGVIRLFGNGEEQRDHMLVDDAVRIIIESLMRRSAGLLNAASGQSVSFAEVARLVCRDVAKGVRVECQPRQTPIAHRHFDIAGRIRAFPGFAATPIEIGLSRTISPGQALRSVTRQETGGVS